MIDTDKYEGHTPAPWDAKPTKSCAWRWVSLGLQVPHDECFSEENTVNLALIADAPLILQALIDEQAEVKRLREGIRDICDTGADTADDWLFMAVKRLEELIE